MVVAIIVLSLAVTYLFFRLIKLENKSITGTSKNNEVTLHYKNKPFNILKIKEQ